MIFHYQWEYRTCIPGRAQLVEHLTIIHKTWVRILVVLTQSYVYIALRVDQMNTILYEQGKLPGTVKQIWSLAITVCKTCLYSRPWAVHRRQTP